MAAALRHGTICTMIGSALRPSVLLVVQTSKSQNRCIVQTPSTSMKFCNYIPYITQSRVRYMHIDEFVFEIVNLIRFCTSLFGLVLSCFN